MVDDAEFQRIRDRLHKLADDIQDMKMKIAACELRISQTEHAAADLRDAMATSDQLEGAVETMSLKLNHITETIDPIKRGVYALVWLMLATIVTAILALVLRTSPTP